MKTLHLIQKTILLIWLPIVCTALTAADEPVKIAIISLNGQGINQAADLLTVDLSRQNNLVILERAEINRVLAEHKLILSKNKQHLLKIARLLKGDGLIILDKAKLKQQKVLYARLVAVNPGIIIESIPSPLPLKNAEKWCKTVKTRFISSFPKLKVKKADAIPMSILNVRSSIDTPQAMLLEKELSLRLINRAIHEKDIFVLERRGMDKLDWEKKLQVKETPFWTGSYLLDGTFHLEKENKIKIKLRIRKPDKKEKWIEVVGNRNELSSLVDLLMTKLMKSIERSPETLTWDQKEESETYFHEAQWAYNAGLYDLAVSAIESAWALGYKTEDAIYLRVKIYYSYAYPDQKNFYKIKLDPDKIDTDNLEMHIAAAIKSLIIFKDLILKNRKSAKGNKKWETIRSNIKLEEKIILNASLLLKICHKIRKTNHIEKKLADLRHTIRETETEIFKDKEYPPFQDCRLKAKYLTFWQETPEETLKQYHKLLTYTFFGSKFEGMRKYLLPNYREGSPLLIDLKNKQNKAEAEKLWLDFLKKLSESKDMIDQVNGLFLIIKFAQLQHNGSNSKLILQSQNKLIDLLQQNREKIFFEKKFAAEKTILFSAFMPPFPQDRLNNFLFELTQYGFQRMFPVKRKDWGLPPRLFEIFEYWIKHENNKNRLETIFNIYQDLRKTAYTDNTAERWIYGKYEKLFHQYCPELYKRKPSQALTINRFWSPAFLPGKQNKMFSLRDIFNIKNKIWTLFSSSTGYFLFNIDLEKNETSTISFSPEKMYLLSLKAKTWKEITSLPFGLIRKKAPKGILVYGHSINNGSYCFLLDPITGKKTPVLNSKIKHSLGFMFENTGIVFYGNGQLYFLFGKDHRTNMMHSLKKYIAGSTQPAVISLKFKFPLKNKQHLLHHNKRFDFVAQKGHSPGTPRGINTDKYFIFFNLGLPGFWYVPIQEVEDFIKNQAKDTKGEK